MAHEPLAVKVRREWATSNQPLWCFHAAPGAQGVEIFPRFQPQAPAAMMPAAATETPLARELARRIRAGGPVSFADYMEACLYDPQFGYYARAEHAHRGDYYTSVEIHPIFGKLLARQLEEMWRLLDWPSQFLIVEPGAGDGRLAQQILSFSAAEFPEFYATLSYVAVERSAVRREALAARLEGYIAAGHATAAAALPEQIAAGCILSNEFFDALPVSRAVVQQGKLREIYVAHEAGRFTELLAPPSPELYAYFERLGVKLREEQLADAGLAACSWITSAGARLGRGFVLTVDYGHDAEELYNDRHMRGSLLAYSGRGCGEDYYRAPGEQDLTAHVNFTALDVWGSDSGLQALGRVSQTQFLLALGRGNHFADLEEAETDEAARWRGRLKLKTLIHPEGMGETFQVVVQSKGIGDVLLTGFSPL